MSNLPDNQQKDSTSKLLFFFGVLIGVVGTVSGIATLFPKAVKKIPFLESATVSCLFAAAILLFLAAYFWCSERMARIDAFLRDSEKLRAVLSGVNENIITVSDMQAQLERMEDELHRKSHFEYNTATVTKLLEDYVQSHASEITEVHIVCFGRNTYEQAINFIAAQCRNITVKVIFCNTKKNKIICREDDDSKIREKIKELLNKHPERNNKIEIFVSDIPPTIRASIVYAGKMEAVWGAIQSYNFEWEDERLTLVRPEKSLCVVADEAYEKNDFKGIIECIEKELKRLGSSANKKASLTDGKVTFIDAEWSGSE